MTFSTETLSRLVLIALGLGVLALVLSALAPGRRRAKQGADRGGRGAPGHPRGPVRPDRPARGRGAIAHATDQRHEGLIEGAVRRVGLVRYDAFEDVGGRLSFSCALLDDHGNGVVMTSINGRAGYPGLREAGHGGQSGYNLSLGGGGGDRAGPRTRREAVSAS